MPRFAPRPSRPEKDDYTVFETIRLVGILMAGVASLTLFAMTLLDWVHGGKV